MWRHTKGKKVEAAMKILKSEERAKYLEDFLNVSGRWGLLQSAFITRLYGISLVGQISMVLEYVRLGPLDTYLQNHSETIQTVDLIEAASGLASALWHLDENGIVHGKIRCRKLLVSSHEENSFIVKLSDPGIHNSYGAHDLHWIPIECYTNLESVKKSSAADVWAYGTTLWEIFSFAEPLHEVDVHSLPGFMKDYASGKRLQKPSSCPNDLYNIMSECWIADPYIRKKPQEIMRDVSRILYQIFNSRRTHAYAKLKQFEPASNASSTSSLFSNTTESTCLTYQDELLSVNSVSDVDGSLSSLSLTSEVSIGNSWLAETQHPLICTDQFVCDYNAPATSIISTQLGFPSTSLLDSIDAVQPVFDLDGEYTVVLQARIGQGFYGEVYRSTLEHRTDKEKDKVVAVKKLKKMSTMSCEQDFEREISIMKRLHHPNIVSILGVLGDPEECLVMEYVPHGSLQSYLKINRDSLSIKRLLKYSLDISKGMEYLGSKKIVHRDLAARNILVVDDHHVKISDFGLAQVTGGHGDYYLLRTVRELPIQWYALESLVDGKFSIRSDVWSFGVTMWEMFSFANEPKLADPDSKETDAPEQLVLIEKLKCGIRLPCPADCPQQIYMRSIYPCWMEEPRSRPSFSLLCIQIKDLITHYSLD